MLRNKKKDERQKPKVGICCLFCLGILVSVFISGCSEDRAELDKEILAEDPGFKKYIIARDEIETNITKMHSNYSKMSEDINNQIILLKEKKASLKTDYIVELEKIKKGLDPIKRGLQQDADELEGKLKLRRIEANDVAKDTKEVEALIARKDRLNLTMEELQAWNLRLSSLVEHRDKIVKEITDLTQKISLMRKKIKALGLN